MSTATIGILPGGISAEEHNRAARYLERVRDELTATIDGLSHEQWHFKPAPDRWSAIECLEHIVVVENAVHGIIAKIPNAPLAGPDETSADQWIVAKVATRPPLLSAPEQLWPTGLWSPAQAIQDFYEARAETLRLLETAPALRGHVIPHPILGALDGYQWILAGGAHGARHTAQIREVFAHPLFPKSGR